MVYKLHKNGAYNIHTIKTDKFKNIRMEIIFRNNIDKENIFKRSVLFDLLMETSKNYKTKRDIVLKLEDLYNALVYSSEVKVGNEILSIISCDFLNPKYTEEDYLSDAIALPFDLIFNPDVQNNEFNSETLETIKTRITSEIKSIKENPQKLAIQNALKAFDEESISSINILGSEDEVSSISPSNIYEFYLEVLKHDYVDIFIIGDIDENIIIDNIVKNAKFDTIKNHELKMDVLNKIRKKEQMVIEDGPYSQTQLVYIFNTLDLTIEEKRYAFVIYNMILGGGSLETKLYRHLRDENSLCYNVRSFYQKFDNLLFISTGIDYKDLDLAKKLINESVSEMKTSISDEELNRAKDAVISSLNMSLDSEERVIDMYLFNYLGSIEPLDIRIEKFKHVTKEDVMMVAKKIKENTVYVLKGGKSSGKD